jgi:hypothetical protein
MMRVMVFGHGNADTEASKMPSEESIEKMFKFNEELVKAGVVLAADGLAPMSRAKKVRFTSGQCTVTDGPFAESKEVIAGYSIWQVKSMEEALEWVKRAPFEEGMEVTIRPIQNLDEKGPLPPELEAKGRSVRAEIERQRKQ